MKVTKIWNKYPRLFVLGLALIIILAIAVSQLPITSDFLATTVRLGNTPRLSALLEYTNSTQNNANCYALQTGSAQGGAGGGLSCRTYRSYRFNNTLGYMPTYAPVAHYQTRLSLCAEMSYNPWSPFARVSKIRISTDYPACTNLQAGRSRRLVSRGFGYIASTQEEGDKELYACELFTGTTLSNVDLGRGYNCRLLGYVAGSPDVLSPNRNKPTTERTEQPQATPIIIQQPEPQETTVPSIPTCQESVWRVLRSQCTNRANTKDNPPFQALCAVQKQYCP